MSAQPAGFTTRENAVPVIGFTCPSCGGQQGIVLGGCRLGARVQVLDDLTDGIVIRAEGDEILVLFGWDSARWVKVAEVRA